MVVHMSYVLFKLENFSIVLNICFFFCSQAKAAEGWEVVGTVSQFETVENVPVISCLEFRWNKPIILVIGISIYRALILGQVHI